MKYGMAILAALLFASCFQKRESIRIKGSDTEVNLVIRLAEAFYKQHPEYLLSVSGGGSGLGIAALINDQADIANSSRAMSDGEKMLFTKKEIPIDTFVFAEDAIAFVVHRDFPQDSITVHDLSKLLSGQYSNWSALTGKALPVNIYGRQSNSGTHQFIGRKLGISFSLKAKEMNGNAQIMEAVKMDPSGIGYVGAGYVLSNQGAQVKVLSISRENGQQAISPMDELAIKNGKYFFQRPLFQFIQQGSINKVQAFLDFEKSAAGLEIIRQAGYYPILKTN
ncbi:substrate-binding domain-containing protein [Flavihumibacter fluvii]|uniref:substrate-binding domain-containing protein n=1 Tax=Flavihumibacter fluvii TaxID=2838157 RepID=UPI001BDF09F3|nr:substrate-binding domain-containing protein [Flavihumibacter fluvii]ULQ54695.1 substrate-binding domain-containing protein [Flavihumibacter fluvii]